MITFDKLILGICLWDDIIEFGGEESWQYSNSYLPALARGIQDRQPEVKIYKKTYFCFKIKKREFIYRLCDQSV